MPNRKSKIMHQAALADCLVFADKWLARYSPDELATVVHEDEASVKRMIKLSLRVLRSVDQMEAQGLLAARGTVARVSPETYNRHRSLRRKGRRQTAATRRPVRVYSRQETSKEPACKRYVLETVLRHLLWSVQEFGAPPA